MTKQSLNVGSAANDNTGDTLRSGGLKINGNFDELYAAIGDGSTVGISVANPGVGQVLRYNGTTFAPANFNALTSALDVAGNNITSSSNGNITLAPNGTGDVRVTVGTVTSIFDGATGNFDVGTTISYKNEYTAIGNAPTAASYPGYFFTVDGDDNPYVNINITAGGAGDVRAKLATEYSSIDLLSDVDTTTAAPTNNQVLKWDAANSKWIPGDDVAGAGEQNIFATVAGDSGSTTANTASDTLTIAGGSNITTAVTGDTVTVSFSGTVDYNLSSLTDTDLTGITQGDSLFWNGTNWVVTRSPITWWEIGANQSNHYTFNGPGFSGPTDDPTLYVQRGMTYAFDNSVQGGVHPFRIQSTQGLSGTAYTTGQSGSGTGVLYWTVPMDAPNTLYYQCTIHLNMNGTINVIF